MKLFLTGSSGQLGFDIKRVFSDWQITECDLPKCDIASKAIVKTIAAAKPDVIIHAGAYTNVAKAEQESKRAFLVNETGSRLVAAESQKASARLVAISTDFIFDGKKHSPYLETDKANPQTVYGKSKLAGEQAIKSVAKDWLIVRTAWLFGGTSDHKNFVTKIIAAAYGGKPLSVVADEIGSPTWTYDLARAIRYLIEKKQRGLFNVVNVGQASRFEQAQFIVKSLGLEVKVAPLVSTSFQKTMPRPAYTVLSTKKLAAAGLIMPGWRAGLKNYLNTFKI